MPIPFDNYPRIELFYNESWNPMVGYQREAAPVTIKWGSADEQSKAAPLSITCQLENKDGRFSPRNPHSPLYGLIGRNVPLRVMDADGVGLYAVGEVTSWPTTWDLSGSDVAVTVEASGISRRLGQGSSPLRSSLTRGLSTRAHSYWPLEDGEGATEFASAVGGPSLSFSGAVSLAQSDAFVASDKLPTVEAGSISGTIPPYVPDPNGQRLAFLVLAPDDGVDVEQVIVTARTFGTGTLWELSLLPDGSLRLSVRNEDGTYNNGSMDPDTSEVAGIREFGGSTFHLNGEPTMVEVAMYYDDLNQELGVTLAATTVADGTYSYVGNSSNSTIDGGVLPPIRFRSVRLSAGSSAVVFGHVAVLPGSFDVGTQDQELAAWTGETATDRITRLCAEEGVPLRMPAGATSDTTMGPQTRDTFLDLLAQVAAADFGMLADDVQQLGLFYRPGSSLLNQTAQVDMVYGNLMPPFEPVSDDQRLRNDVTVSRPGGSSARAVVTDGPLSVESVGRYDADDEVNVATDAQLQDQAGWRAHLGTIDEDRYPSITVDVRAVESPIDDSYYDMAVPAFLGDRVTVTQLPEWMAPDTTVDQIILGGQVTMTPYQHVFTWNLAPASAWSVPITNDQDARADTVGSELAAPVSTTDTSFSVATTAGPLWTTDPSDLVFYVDVAGENVQVQAVAGTSSPQTFTVSRSRNSVVKSHAAGTPIKLWRASVVSLME